MAYTYDAFGNYVDQAALDEEERRRKAEEEAMRIAQLNQQGALLQTDMELGPVAPTETADIEQKPASDTVARKSETITYADGSKTEKTTREIPAGAEIPEPVRPDVGPTRRAASGQAPQNPLNQVAGAGRGFVNPPVVAVAPASGGDAYNDRIAQAESGNDATIGYHAPGKSSAYGKYGITKKAWEGAQQSVPELRGLDITQATPEQMELAQRAVTNNNARYLANYGVPVNDNTLAAAHFIGAKGLANFLRDGSISENAARANGGYERTKQIIEQRLGGQAAPASGASTRSLQEPVVAGEVQRPSLATPGIVPDQPALGSGLRMPQQQQEPRATQNHIEQYQNVQNDPAALLKMRDDKNVPQFLQERAAQRAADLLSQDLKMKQAQAQAAKMVAEGDTAGIAKTIAAKGSKDEFKSIMRSMFLRMMGANKAADEELANIGYGNSTKVSMDAKGNQAAIEYDVTGRIIGGTTSDGRTLTPAEAIAYSAGMGKTKADVSTQDVEKNGMAGRVVTQHLPNGTTRTVVESNGQMFPYDASWKPRSISTAITKEVGKNQVQLAFSGPMAYTKAGAEFAGKFNAENGTNIGYATQSANAPLIDFNTGLPVTMNADGTITATVGGKAQAQPQKTEAVAPPAQQQAPAKVEEPVAPPKAAPAKVEAPATPQTVASGAPVFREPGYENESPASFKQRQEVWKAGATKTATTVAEDIGKIKVAQPKVEENADYLIAKVDELITHPGFGRAVGVYNAPALGGFPIPYGGTIAGKLPGTAVTDWNARLAETKGRTFLDAFESLRGGGQITEKEGEKATEALNRMNAATSEEEFKLAAKDFTEVVKRAVDRNRAKLKQEPKYGVEAESKQSRKENLPQGKEQSGVKPMTQEQQQAVEWVRKNPNDPRAAEIKKRLGL